jgi:hypothetical protein
VSGLIYAVIIILWAGYLGSMVLRRHDENESRSVDRFSTAMRILSRRNRPSADRRYVVAPPGAATDARQHPFVKGGQRQTARLRVMRRRRSALALILVMTMTVGGLAAAGGLPWWSVAVSGAVLAAYVLHLRLQAHHARAASRRTVEAADRGRPALQRPARSAATRPARGERRARPVRVPEYQAAATWDRSADENRLIWDEDEDGWEPRPWPLPTYVTAPVAPPMTRSIDLGGLDDEEPSSVVAATSVGDIDELDLPTPADEDILDEIHERRRAVGD